MASTAALHVLREWIIYGDKFSKVDRKMPQHPEFFYRKSGEWESWNAFLAVPQGSPDYQTNAKQDEVETEAWMLYESLTEEQLRFIRKEKR